MAQGQLDNYSLGSFGNSYSAVEKTVGAGVALATANGGSVSANISSLANGSMAMGAKTMAQTIGYGNEVHLSDAMVSGELSGIMDANKDNYLGSNMTKADARALGTQQGASLVNQGEALIHSGAYTEYGRMTELGRNYNLGLQKEQARSINKSAKIGEEVSFDNANRVGELEGITSAQSMNTTAEKMNDNQARALGTGNAISQISSGQNWLKSPLTNSDGAFNGDAKVSDVLGKFHNDLEKEKERIAADYDKKIAAARSAGDTSIANKLMSDKLKAIDNINDKIAQVDKEMQEAGDTSLYQAYLEGNAKGFTKSLMKQAGYGISGEFSNSLNAGMIEGIKAGGADKGEYLAVVKDKGGIGDLFEGAEREARVATNKTIGAGEAVLTDKNGNQISEEKFMGFVKAGAAKGFLAQGIAGEADLEKAFGGQGANGEKKLRGEIAKGLYRSEEANLGNIAGMAHLRDKNGNLISDDEFYKNIREGSIEKGTTAQAHAKEMRESYGDTLSGTYTVKGKSKTFANRAAAVAKKDVASFAGMADADANHSGNEFYDNAFYGEDSKIKSAQKKIQKAGNASQAADIEAAAAGFNFDKLIGEVSGKESMNPEHIKKFFEKILEKAKSLDLGRYNEVLKDLQAAGIADANGNIRGDVDSYIKGTSFLNTRAISSLASIVAGGMKISGALGDNPTVQMDALNSVKAGDTSTIDNSHNSKQWGNLDIARTFVDAIESKIPGIHLSEKEKEALTQKLASKEEYMNAVKRGDYGKALAELMIEGEFNNNNDNNLPNKDGNPLYGAATTMIGSSVLAGTAIHKIKNALDGQRMATEDMTVHDKFGREMNIKKGDSFNISEIAPDERELVKSKSKIDETYMGKILRKTKENIKSFARGNIFNKSFTETPNSTHNNESTNKNQITPDEPHSKSPSLNSDLSINDKNENVKILKLFFVFWLVFGS